ncbi:CsgG/HfaB family protein [Brevundimonas variabilis]|uniref:Curli production assembly/transport component CsgG n=1 Tax=Brevundimonas variabilis TaxID=74312 RepID=A0A7W9CIH8_9CAUL|nr:CsgG/HfaB family protein [Brevundimonas variabilis]MBB5746289.1 curli production assembly/transport component CsgG [Brevundimonas variabilis]
MRSLIFSALCAILLAGCGTIAAPPLSLVRAKPYSAPVLPAATSSRDALAAIPAPSRPVAVAVYSFTDQTGQFRPSETGQTLSRAVSQGGASILMKALQDTGNRSWFTVIEREQLSHLLNERQIIREMRERYLGETGVNPEALPSLLFAGVILEGGIVGYDSNTMTGGVGAGFLGINARSEYRQDTVTVYLRAVSVRTGEVLTSVTASKTIASYGIGGGAFRYIGFKELLEAEAGLTTNEPDQVALQQAIEKAVYGLVMEGVELNLWNFADTEAGWPMLWSYQQERAGKLTAEQAEAVRQRMSYALATEATSPQSSRPREMSSISPGDQARSLQVSSPQRSPAQSFSGLPSASTVSVARPEQSARPGL